MLNEFKKNLLSLIEKGCSFSTGENPKILAAVSGGVDSMTMASLLYSSGYTNFAVATVNFKLRGKESDADEALVKRWSVDRGVKFYSTSFETESYARSEKISIEMAARDLRYSWFYDIMEKEGYDYLAIAHNLNDSVETLFLNLLRGTGIDGLSGIRMKNGLIIRPMLKFSRQEIDDYAAKEEIPYRVDRTNLESYYSRNRIRNRIFPEFEAINQSFLRTIERSIEYFNTAGEIIKAQYARKREQIIEYSKGTSDIKINISVLMNEEHSKYWLYMLLSEYGFNSSQADQIFDSLEGQPGKEFHSITHLLIRDRDYLLVYSKGEKHNPPRTGYLTDGIIIKEPDSFGYMVVFRGKELQFRCYPIDIGFKPIPSKSVFYMDADKIKFPLVCRIWKVGDKFIPLGMKGYKKLSDFFIDEKVDIKSKEEKIVLISGENIVCLPGHRIDDRCKITDSTSNIFEVQIN
ncbi:MAG: tRNA lysidine(34) synthetase TilS [Bacteroidales bacterium]|jgi:tRNA(Ile)-lysidine synthase